MSKKLPDLTGEHFGRWTVIEYAGRGNHGEVQYKCRCDCGTERVLRRTSLTSGNSKSCGCLSRDVAKERGTTHGDSKSRLYRIWAGIIQRCCNDRERYEWEKYGGRGINVCTEWHKYEAFRDWALSNGYSDELTIDRIDVNGDYCPNTGMDIWDECYCAHGERTDNDSKEKRGERKHEQFRKKGNASQASESARNIRAGDCGRAQKRRTYEAWRYNR